MDGGDERDVGFCWLGDALSEPLITLIFVMGCDGWLGVVWGLTLEGMTTKVQSGVCNVPNRTIFEGDNLDVMRGMNDGCVDLI